MIRTRLWLLESGFPITPEDGGDPQKRVPQWYQKQWECPPRTIQRRGASRETTPHEEGCASPGERGVLHEGIRIFDMKKEEPNPKGLFGFIKEAFSKSAGCCGAGQTCGTPETPPVKPEGEAPQKPAEKRPESGAKPNEP
jgi:hypothetical protein